MAGSHLAVKVHIGHVVKKFNGRSGGVVALGDVDMGIHEDEFTCVVGPSGCGRSTLPNIIDKLEAPTKGKVLADGIEVAGPGPDRGIVLQQYTLFPWFTVEKNVQFGLKLQDKSKEGAEGLAHEYLKMVDLEGPTKTCPKEFSGGVKQRVTITRAYAVNPKVLLVDEPLGVLDAQTRTQLQQELPNIWREEQKTYLFIAHNVEEAIVLVQQVVIMRVRPGRVEEIVDTDIPYLRGRETKMSPRFLELKNHIWSQVYQKYLPVHR